MIDLLAVEEEPGIKQSDLVNNLLANQIKAAGHPIALLRFKVVPRHIVDQFRLWKIAREPILRRETHSKVSGKSDRMVAAIHLSR